MNLLRQSAHRPWPLPARPWIMAQTWHNLLFAHWPIDHAALRPLVPPDLQIDTIDGRAWVGIVAFRLSGIRLRGLPPMPLVASFSEINVRTYVTYDGVPGVLFLSLDADNRLATSIAKPWFRLGYLDARIRLRQHSDVIGFDSERREPGAPPAAFSAVYRPTAPVIAAEPGSLANWLTERYCYYTAGSRGQIYRCDIHHPQWPLQQAGAEIAGNTMLQAHNLPLPSEAPLLHYAHHLRAAVWRIKRVDTSAARVLRSGKAGVKFPLPAGEGWGEGPSHRLKARF